MLKLFHRQGVTRCALLAIAGAVLFSVWGREAKAQLTAEAIIGQAVSDSGAPRYQDVADAIVRFQNNDLNGARALLESAKKKDAKLPPAEVMLARMLLSANQLEMARN